jgi:hypothetical protein
MRLDPRQAFSAFERSQQRRLFAADISSGAAVDHHVQVEAKPWIFLPSQPWR